MPELESQTTPPVAPAGTDDGKQPPATTPPDNGSGVTTGDDEMVTIRKSDLKKLQSQRDTNGATAAKTQEQLEQHQAMLEDVFQEKGVKNFIKANREKYPDLKFSDLEHVTNPDDLEKEADRIQRRLQDHTQARLAEIENNTVPVLTPDQIAAQEAELEKNGSPESLAKAIELRMNNPA